jgi:hypothetical protein
MTFTIKKCDICEEDVEIDTDNPTLSLNPSRDKVRHPRALHICKGPSKPKTLIRQFAEAPEVFLQTNVIVVDEEEQLPNGSGRIQQFKLSKGRQNGILLQFKNEESEDGIAAYWLPWNTDEATTMTLGDEADFFFTSELTNCRFSVLDPDLKRPKVAHVAGTLMGSKRRDAAEISSNFTETSEVRARRLSISEGKDIKGNKWVKSKQKKHDYRGQSGDSSSAFVFGWRDDEGNWKFKAQIVKGNMSNTEVIKNTLAEDLEILNYCYRI